VLQDRVKATSDSTAPLVYGTILHEIFQAAMLANRWDTEWLDELIEAVATRHLEDLYTISLQVPQAVNYLQSKMGELQAWAELFVSSQPKVCSSSISDTCMLIVLSLKRLSVLAMVRQLLCASGTFSTLRNMFGRQCMGSKAISMLRSK
jgi:hypothetical protein